MLDCPDELGVNGEGRRVLRCCDKACQEVHLLQFAVIVPPKGDHRHRDRVFMGWNAPKVIGVCYHLLVKVGSTHFGAACRPGCTGTAH